MRARCSAFVQHLSVCARAEKLQNLSPLCKRVWQQKKSHLRAAFQASQNPPRIAPLRLSPIERTRPGRLATRQSAAAHRPYRCHAAHCARGARASTCAPQTAPGVYFAPWTTKLASLDHTKRRATPPQQRRPTTHLSAFVRTRVRTNSAHCARCSGVDARPTNRTRRVFRPLGQPNWRRWTTPKGEASLTLGFPTLAR